MVRLIKFLIFLVIVGGIVLYMRRDYGSYEAQWPVMGTIAKFSAKGLVKNQPINRMRELTVDTFSHFEERLSYHDPHSELREAFKDFKGAETELPEDQISRETLPCYEFAVKMKQLSGGAFNPYWKGDGSFDLGGIAKGFALDRTCDALKEKFSWVSLEKTKFLLDLGGNLKSLGGTWKVGIRDPYGKPGDVAMTLELLPGEAVATSGEYERGKHIYDGRTMQPAAGDVASVTVIHPNSAMTADALSTTLFVLGMKDGEEFLAKNFPEARAFWIMKKEE